jgi:hypothetical protein
LRKINDRDTSAVSVATEEALPPPIRRTNTRAADLSNCWLL